MRIVDHLYVHVPFCGHRCGYCDFVTVTGRESQRERYVDAVLRELAARGSILAEEPATVYLGGGTPSRLGPELLARLLDELPRARAECTVECNPEDVDSGLAAVLASHGCRVSLGAQTLQQPLLDVLERRTSPSAVAAAVSSLREAGVEDLSLDLIYGVPGADRETLAADLAGLIALEPDHISAYELEAKPGTRFAVHHGAALAEQAEHLEDQYDQVIDTLGEADFDWYEVASFARDGRQGVHNRAYWEGRDYLGVGIGAVSTVAGERRRNGPRLGTYLDDPISAAAEIEVVDPDTRQVERLLLGLRLADGVPIDEVSAVLDRNALDHLVAQGLAASEGGTLRLRRRGRMLLHDCVAALIHDDAL